MEVADEMDQHAAIAPRTKRHAPASNQWAMSRLALQCAAIYERGELMTEES